MDKILETHTRAIGANAERIAREYLQQQGLQFITNNYQCRLGEIDLIMQDDTHLIFVEVRFRSDTNHEQAAQSITLKKQRRLTKTALAYLQGPGRVFHHKFCRFDVVLINIFHKIDWIKNAFQVQY